MPYQNRHLFKTKAKNTKHKMAIKVSPKQRLESHPKIKKHHWCLGTLIILAGSWITHTTTATVYNGTTSYSGTTSFNETSTQPSSQQFFDQHFFADLPAIDGSFYGIASDNSTKLDFLESTDGLSTTDQVLDALENQLEDTVYTVKSGDTLSSIAKKLALDTSLPHEIAKHSTAKKLASLSVDKDLVFKRDQAQQLKQINYPVTALQELVVNLEDGAVLDAQINDLPFETVQKSASGVITSSLYEAALEAGISNAMVMEMARIFGWDIDFVLDIQDGDQFHVLYDEHHMNGEKLSDGVILAAEFTTQGKTHRAIRFVDQDGHANYYTPQGESMVGAFLRSPVEYSRISSGFGRRKHPILKTWRAHKGVDYAASRGTPIRATADGKIVHLGRKGGYGKTIVLRHAGTYSTLYAHMNGYAKGLKSGARVQQGQVIGYIGSTGLATGPHLHYEFRLAGNHRDPLKQKNTKAEKISGSLLSAFNRHASDLLVQLEGIANTYQVAQSEVTTNTL